LVQLRFRTGLTSEEYVSQEAWRFASLERCPVHPDGRCGVARHGTYRRKTPDGVLVPRWYCPEGHLTISLLPDFAASRLSSGLDEVEQVAIAVEGAVSLEAAASELRPDIELPGAVRWTRRRVRAVRTTLVTSVGLLPGILAGVELNVKSFRAALGAERVLVALREAASVHLSQLPPPVGFGPRPIPRGRGAARAQHKLGPDPPVTPT
jgi:hypothetical protein